MRKLILRMLLTFDGVVRRYLCDALLSWSCQRS